MDDVIDVTIDGEALEGIKAIVETALLVAGDWDAAAAHCEAAKQMCEQLRDGVL